jgi:anaerobic magnesium-protoporphyrin IX monomethyl ester cyclase
MAMTAADLPGTASEFELACGRERDATRNVVLIGFRNQGNLGLGYLAATLERVGYHVEVIDVDAPPREVLETILSLDPVVVGFSLIFQFWVQRYEELAGYLRAGGVACHFTMGGHFPSLSYAETLELVPQLDSVVRFEGELTLLELCDRIGRRQDWRDVDGIAYRRRGELVTTPMRPLLANLDDLPRPYASVDTRRILGRKVGQMIASRGCARTCSFCSIHMFYRVAPGKVVRTRAPAEVAREMRYLLDEFDTTVLLFQDDDFPMFGPAWHRWTRSLLEEIRAQNLVGRMLWKVNCRADAADPVLLAEMRDAGLYLVYMGLESGSEQGLETLHKQIDVAQNEAAVATMKELGLLFDFGFMMLDPSSTFESIENNVAFLRRIVGDGSAAAEFCRMVPYDGTPIKDSLAAEGRLRGDVLNPDYDFLDPRIEEFFTRVDEALNTTGWIHGLRALSPQLKFAWNEVAVLEGFMPSLPGLTGYRARLQQITRESNETLMLVVEDLVAVCRDGAEQTFLPDELAARCETYVDRLLEERNAYVVSNQDELLAAIGLVPA